ncbi:DoxX family protein [Leucobacter sp. W1153]|uniref:DoxX family protein n=1 Tax=Leucobacter sp. W1153 TaxID=3439064 RepID=UPI003F319EA4
MLEQPIPPTPAPLDEPEARAREASRGGGSARAARTIARALLGAALLFAGIGHLTALRAEFQAQVPTWLPLDADFVVVASGVVEILLGAALLFAPRVARPIVGLIVALFFVAIFPGNISQYVEGVDAFGLSTDAARLGRLFFQPVLVVWALWSTGAWRWLRSGGFLRSRM